MQINDIVLFGLSHKSAPLAIREKAALPEAACLQGMGHLAAVVGEILIYSTCNRVEILYVANDKDDAREQVAGFFETRTGLARADFESYCYTKTGLAAVKHIFSVAASLDSMVVGETQILGQIKQAYARGLKARSTGVVLNRLLHKAFAAAKRVRTETTVGSHTVSISHAAVALAGNLCGNLGQCRALLIGAGEMGALAAQKLALHRPKELLIVNRTHAKAQALARDLGGSAVKWEDLHKALDTADIVISSAVCEEYILNREDLHNRKRPLVLVDIGLPRNLDPAIGDLTNCRLYDLDALQTIVKKNMALREAEAKIAENIIDAEVLAFAGWLREFSLKPTMLALRTKLQDIVVLELAKSKAQFTAQEDADKLAKAVVNRFLHEPTSKLKNAAHGENHNFYLDVLRKLFDLDT